jgi:hypothetical protein
MSSVQQERFEVEAALLSHESPPSSVFPTLTHPSALLEGVFIQEAHEDVQDGRAKCDEFLRRKDNHSGHLLVVLNSF